MQPSCFTGEERNARRGDILVVSDHRVHVLTVPTSQELHPQELPRAAHCPVGEAARLAPQTGKRSSKKPATCSRSCSLSGWRARGTQDLGSNLSSKVTRTPGGRWADPRPRFSNPALLRLCSGPVIWQLPPAGLGWGWGKGALRGEGRAMSIPEGPERQGQGAKGL